LTSNTLAPLPRPTKAPATEVLSASRTLRPKARRLSDATALRSALDMEALLRPPPSCRRISQVGTCTCARAGTVPISSSAPPIEPRRLNRLDA
jgi:hypothetical protein